MNSERNHLKLEISPSSLSRRMLANDLLSLKMVKTVTFFFFFIFSSLFAHRLMFNETTLGFTLENLSVSWVEDGTEQKNSMSTPLIFFRIEDRGRISIQVKVFNVCRSPDWRLKKNREREMVALWQMNCSAFALEWYSRYRGTLYDFDWDIHFHLIIMKKKSQFSINWINCIVYFLEIYELWFYVTVISP